MNLTQFTPDFAKAPKVGKTSRCLQLDLVVKFSLKKLSLVSLFVVGTFVLALPIGSVFAATPGFGSLYYNGTVVRTVVPLAAFPNTGIDNFYKVTNGAAGQLGIASVAPGADGYHGGHWKVFLVTFHPDATPVLLRSQAAVLAAQSAGTVTVTRNASSDFLCPVQP
jgi:hypothetical protein